MADQATKPSILTFPRALELLGQAAEDLMRCEGDGAKEIAKASALANVTNAGMKVVQTAATVAGMRSRPDMLTKLLGDTVIEDAPNRLSNVLAEIEVVGRELATKQLTRERSEELKGRLRELNEVKERLRRAAQ